MRKLFIVLLVLIPLLLSASVVPEPNTVNAQDNGPATPSLPNEGDVGEETPFIEGPFSLPVDSDTQENPSGDLIEPEVIEGPFYLPVDSDTQENPSGDLIEPEVIEGPFSLPVDSDTQENPSGDLDESGAPNGETDSSNQEFSPESGITVTSAWTTDGSGNTKSVFNAGEAIRYVGNVSNTTGATRSAYFVWTRTGPCGTSTLWSGYLNTIAGTQTWYLGGTVPTNCAGSYSYKLAVTYNGQTSSRTAYFTVNGGGSITVTSAWTADGSGNTKSVFNAAEAIRYVGNVSNTTGATRSAYFVWTRTGPCGTNTLWSGYLNTIAGTQTWYLSGTVPTNCAGSYSYKLAVTYNGQTSSRTAYFTVNGSVTVTSAWTADGSGNTKSVFNAGEAIRYMGNVSNTTGATRNTYFVWTRTGPCGTSTLWSGYLNTISGIQTWYLGGATPNSCPGSYSYTLRVTYNGQTTSRTAYFTVNGIKGVDYHPRGNFYVFKIDMTSSNLSFETVMANDANSGNPPNAEYVSNMVARAPYTSRNPVLAFNADYFGVNHHGAEGLTVKNGTRLPNAGTNNGEEWRRSSLSISSNKTLRVGRQTDCSGPPATACSNWVPNSSAYYNTVGGGPLFINNGQRIGGTGSTQPCNNEYLSTSYCTNSFAWTAVGISQDGRYLIVVVTKPNYSQTMDQAAAVLIAEGAWRAIKLDGGGSTQVWYKGPGSLVNGSRPVANAVLVFSTP